MGKPSTVFLSVVLRTQLESTKCLQEALGCLEKQTFQDIEVVVVLHSENKLQMLEDLVESFSTSFREKLKIVLAPKGNRGLPLNCGIDASAGRYIAFFDDDDLLEPNWSEAFFNAAAMEPNSIIRSQAAILDSEYRIDLMTGKEEIIDGLLHNPYPKTFNLLQHWLVNQTPFMSLAFPRILFSKYNLRADESLLVCEDWDLLLRATQILPVIDIPETTALYRRWSGKPSSYAVHSAEDWSKSEEKVLTKHSNAYIQIPAANIADTRSNFFSESETNRLKQIEVEHSYMLNSLSWRITSPLRLIRQLLSGLNSKK